MYIHRERIVGISTTIIRKRRRKDCDMLRSVFSIHHDRLAIAFDGGTVLEVGPEDGHGTTEAGCITTEGKLANIIDLAYSSDASMLVLATEDKHLRLHRTTKRWGGGEGARKQPGSVCNDDATELGQREIPKKPTRVLFSPTPDGKEVIVVSDKCGDVYAAPLPDPASALKHLLGHTAMTITSMTSLKNGKLLATGDRAEHIRISEFPRTSIIHTYLLGHKDFVSVLVAVPGGDGTLLISGGGDGMVGLWDADTSEELSMISVRQPCQELPEDDDDDDDDDASQEVAEHTGSEATTAGTGLSYPGTGGATLANISSPEYAIAAAGGESGHIQQSEGASTSDYTAEPRDSGQGDVGGLPNGRSFSEGGASAADDGADGRDGGDDIGDGVPISIACSEDGGMAAVVVSGFAGVLVLKVVLEGGDKPFLSRLAQLKLPAVPIQADFLGEALIVALPSPSPCLEPFLCKRGPDGSVKFEVQEEGAASLASRYCAAINRRARADGLVLRMAMPDRDATEALEGGLRKHKGLRSVAKDPHEWNNFSKRRDKKLQQKRKRPWYHPSGYVEASSAEAGEEGAPKANNLVT